MAERAKRVGNSIYIAQGSYDMVTSTIKGHTSGSMSHTNNNFILQEGIT